MTNEEIKEFLESLKQFDGLDLKQKAEEYAKIWPKMTEEEARQLLQEYFERICEKDPNVQYWIGEAIGHDYTGYTFQAGLYSKDDIPGKVWWMYGVDALRKTCGVHIM